MKSLVKTILIYGMFIVAVCSTACDASKNEAPLVVSDGTNNITTYKNTNDFNEIMNAVKEDDLIYVENEKDIYIKFNDEIPDNIYLVEYIINEKGDYKYMTEKVEKSINISWNDNQASFKMEPNMATLFSSDIKDYDKGATIKGYRMVCEWKNGKSEYLFVIKTDAAVVNE